MKRDGTSQLSPVLVAVDSQDRLVVSTRETAMKTLNVRRDSRAWLCVLNDRFFGDWAQLSGDVEVVSLYDDELAQRRFEQVNATFRREIESVAEQLKRKY